MFDHSEATEIANEAEIARHGTNGELTAVYGGVVAVLPERVIMSVSRGVGFICRLPSSVPTLAIFCLLYLATDPAEAGFDLAGHTLLWSEVVLLWAAATALIELYQLSRPGQVRSVFVWGMFMVWLLYLTVWALAVNEVSGWAIFKEGVFLILIVLYTVQTVLVARVEHQQRTG